MNDKGTLNGVLNQYLSSLDGGFSTYNSEDYTKLTFLYGVFEKYIHEHLDAESVKNFEGTLSLQHPNVSFKTGQFWIKIDGLPTHVYERIAKGDTFRLYNETTNVTKLCMCNGLSDRYHVMMDTTSGLNKIPVNFI